MKKVLFMGFNDDVVSKFQSKFYDIDMTLLSLDFALLVGWVSQKKYDLVLLGPDLNLYIDSYKSLVNGEKVDLDIVKLRNILIRNNNPDYVVVFAPPFPSDFCDWGKLEQKTAKSLEIFKSLFFRFIDEPCNTKGSELGALLWKRFRKIDYFEFFWNSPRMLESIQSRDADSNFVPKVFDVNESFTHHTFFSADRKKDCLRVFKFTPLQGGTNLRELAVIAPHASKDDLHEDITTILEFIRHPEDDVDWGKVLKDKFKSSSPKAKYPFVGDSFRMSCLYRDIFLSVLDDSGHILITGETGTGKELTADVIHMLSARNVKKLAKINCATLGENLAHSVLFGHVKGAYTGADTARKGLVATADGGMLFLDEVQALPHQTKNMLLRYMETRDYQKLGSNKTEKSNVRIIAATNDANLTSDSELVNSGFINRFRYIIGMPPLWVRDNDVSLLAEHFYEEISEELKGKIANCIMPPKVSLPKDYFTAQHWKCTNVRGLKNAVRNWFLRALAALNLGNLDSLSTSKSSKDKKPRGIKQDLISDDMLVELLEKHKHNWEQSLQAGFRDVLAEKKKKNPKLAVFGVYAYWQSLRNRIERIDNESQRAIARTTFAQYYAQYPKKRPRKRTR